MKLEISFLATTTGSRLDLFEELLVSFNALEVPTGFKTSLFVLDQAPERHEEIFKRNGAALGKSITRIQSETLLGLSLARNRLIARLSGDGYVVFCDDDATYPANFLSSLQQEFARSGQMDIGVFRLLNKEQTGTYGNRKYPALSRPLGRHELINLAISLNLVMRLKCLVEAGGFNEDLGVGSKGLCGEETELVLKALDKGATASYFQLPFAFHPSQALAATDNVKLYNYSHGYREMLLGYRGSLGLRMLVRWHLSVAIARSLLALAIRRNERAGRLIKLRGLLGMADGGSHHG